MKTNDILKNKSFPLPDEVIESLEVALNTFKESKDKSGLKRAKFLVKEKKISFKEMERLKNFFETEANLSEDESNEQEYRLSGGALMKEFCTKGVKKLRGMIDKEKRGRMKNGRPNQFQKEGGTKDKNANPTKVSGLVKMTSDGEHSKVSDKIESNKATYYENYKKEIDSIKYLIEYMDSNKKLI